MRFASLDEADLAYSLGAIDMHARIEVRLPADRCERRDEETISKPGERITTSYGRILFNMMLPKGMDFYNMELRSGDLASVISDCYRVLGRRATIDLLDDMNQLGFRESTRSGSVVRHGRPGDARYEVADHRRKREEGAAVPQAVREGRDHRSRTLQPGARHLDARPRKNHDGNDGRDEGRRPRRRATSTPCS